MTNLFLPQATFGISLRTSSAFWGNRENLREDCTRRRRECASLAIIGELARRLANFQGLIIPRGQTDTLLRWIDQERLGERLTWTRQLADYILRRSRIPCALSSNFFFFFFSPFFHNASPFVHFYLSGMPFEMWNQDFRLKIKFSFFHILSYASLTWVSIEGWSSSWSNSLLLFLKSGKLGIVILRQLT